MPSGVGLQQMRLDRLLDDVSNASSSRSATSAQSASGTSCPITAAIASGLRVSSPSRATRPSITCRRKDGTQTRSSSPSVQPSLVSAEQRFLLQGAQEFGGEERVSLGVPLQVGDEARLVRSLGRRTGRDQGAQGVRVEAAQIEPQPLRLADQRRQLHGEGVASGQFVAPVGDEQQDRPVPQVRGEVAQEVEAGRIGPMEVFEEDESRTGGGELGEERRDLGEERGLVGHRRQPTAGEGGRGRGRSGSRRHASNRSSHGPYGGVFVRS